MPRDTPQGGECERGCTAVDCRPPQQDRRETSMPHRLLAGIALLLLGGCAAQMQPVADFGAAANHLAEVYKPFAAGMGASCERRERTVARGNAGAYDDAAAERAAASR